MYGFFALLGYVIPYTRHFGMAYTNNKIVEFLSISMLLKDFQKHLTLGYIFSNLRCALFNASENKRSIIH